MKTRSEMVYDFMLALANGHAAYTPGWSDRTAATMLDQACELADQYLKFISGV